MKLLRLTTTDENAIFDNNYNANIVIQPKSQIALKSLSIETTIADIVINSVNDKLQFQVAENQGALTTQLTHSTYSNITYPSLFADMNQKLNSKINPIAFGSNIGMEVKTAVQNKGPVNIKFRQGALNENENSIVLDKGAVAVSKTGTQPSTRVYSSAGTPSGNDCYMYDPTPIARGGGVFRFKINQIGNTTDNFILGLTSVNPDTLAAGTTFDINDINYGIKCGQSSFVYSKIVGGIVSATTQLPNFVGIGNTNNDSIVLEINQGNVVGSVYDGSGQQQLLSETYVYPTDLYPILIFLGDGTHTSARLFRFTHSPYHNDPVLTDLVPLNEGQERLSDPPRQSKTETLHFFNFESQSLASFLGFDNIRTPQTGFEKILIGNFEVIAPNNFRPNNVSDAFVIEMLNLPLNSYDGLVSERRNILSVIPESDAQGVVIYDAKELVFIDIDNAEPFTLRNLRARVLNNDLSEIEMRGLASLVVLIKDPQE